MVVMPCNTGAAVEHKKRIQPFENQLNKKY
jgi:hypothetical protein